MLSREEVKHIAKLARLGLTEKEITDFQKELFSILDYFEKLKEVDASNVKPLSHPFEIKNIIRKDEPETTANKDKLLELMPERKGSYLKVKSVF